VSELNQVA